MGLDLLLQETKGLSEEALMEVVRFVRFMKIESANMSGFVGLNEVNNGNGKIRTAGKYRGKGWMSDDFDAPLEDFKEYME